jgi:hypothetical protein
MMFRRARATLCSAVVCLAAQADASIAFAESEPSAESLPRRQANFAWEKNEKTGETVLFTGVSFRDIVDRPLSEKLSSGLPMVIAVRAYVLREGEADPVALAVRTCRVVYDLWDEVYRLKVSMAGAEREAAALNLEGVLRQCAEVRDFRVAEKSQLSGKGVFFLGVIVEVNPVSPQMLVQMRQWVSRPAGSTGIGPGDALFGSFVGLFVRQLGNAERTLRFRTQPIPP